VALARGRESIIRDYLNQRLRRLYLRVLTCLILLIAGLLFNFAHPLLMLMAFVCFGVLAITWIELSYGIQCPRCKSNLRYAQMSTFDWCFMLSKKIKSCPYCDLDFDASFAEVGLPTP
jgi:hypothetical protein